MVTVYLRLIIIALSTGLISPYPGPTPNLPHLVPGELVWKPYLQQLTATGVIILWTTTTGANSTVRYSTDTSYHAVANGISRPLSQLGTQLHRVQLAALQPDTTYHYKIYTDGQDLLSKETLSFKTAPPADSTAPFTFLAFGDFGRDSNSQRRLRDQMLRDTFSFVLTTGDNAYRDGTYDQFDQKVFQVYGDIFKRSAIFPTLGNHDYHDNDGAPYLDLFDLPGNAGSPEAIERYYSFDYGDAHFVGLDSNILLNAAGSAASTDMLDWLRNDLGQTTRRWKIVAFHHPAYSTGKHGSNSRVQAGLVPILEEFGVDLVLTGHDHIYQRTHPLRAGQVTPVEKGGIVYIVSGAGHQASYTCSQAGWSAVEYCSEAYGLYSRITVNRDSLRVEAVDEEGNIKDHYLIVKNMPASSYLPIVMLAGFVPGQALPSPYPCCRQASEL